jgi:acyl-coenzyme A synthetase/AMP-(fatty) acid ligase
MLDYKDTLLPGLVDAQAASDPDKLYGAFATSTKPGGDVVRVSYSRMANAVNRLAWFLEATFGTTYETLAYVGPADFRYPIFALAASKTGHQVNTSAWQSLSGSE